MTGFVIQDNLNSKNIFQQDTFKQLSDSVTFRKHVNYDSNQLFENIPAALKANPVIHDSLTVCSRNNTVNVTFYETNNVISQIDKIPTDRFPFNFVEINRHQREKDMAILIKHLKDGQELTSKVFHDDWIMIIILMSAFLYGLIRTLPVNMFQGLLKFILLRGIHETVARDLGGLFYWQSTLFNFASFLNINTFTYFSFLQFDIIPEGINKFYVWIISLGIIITSLTIRHIVCVLTGNISGENEAFREYLAGIYQSYRLAGIISFIFVILISYTFILPEKVFFITGFSMIILIYFIRLIRLLIIFINRHISIFYLILYICALEILPVVILLKYFTGLG